jgi:protein disulfide-isomerase A1
MLPSALEIDSKEELDKLAEEKGLTAVAYISPEDTESLNKWQSMADMLGSAYDFAYVTNPDLAKEQSVTEFPSLAIYKPFDDRLELLSGLPANEVELNRKMTMNSMPVLGAVGEVDLTPYYMTGQPLVFYFYKGQEMRENTDKMVRPLAEKYKGQLHMLHADVKKYGKRAKDFDLPKNAFPAVAAHNLNTDDRYHIDQKKIISAEEVESFIQEVLESEKKSSLQKRAESTIDHANITQITAAEFDKIVLDPKKDVLLEVFSPTCGHCQQFAPTWAQFNDVLKQADSATHDVIAVRMDGLNEMLPASAGFQLAGFPTVKLYKAENNAAGLKNMIDYNGDRSLQDLINFINTQTTKKTFHIDTPEAGSSSRDEL